MELKVDSIRNAPEIEIDADMVERSTSGLGSGPTIATVDVIHSDEDGEETRSRFFISVKINCRGQAVCEVATNTGRSTKSARVTAFKTNRLGGPVERQDLEDNDEI